MIRRVVLHGCPATSGRHQVVAEWLKQLLRNHSTEAQLPIVSPQATLATILLFTPPQHLQLDCLDITDARFS